MVKSASISKQTLFFRKNPQLVSLPLPYILVLIFLQQNITRSDHSYGLVLLRFILCFAALSTRQSIEFSELRPTKIKWRKVSVIEIDAPFHIRKQFLWRSYCGLLLAKYWGDVGTDKGPVLTLIITESRSHSTDSSQRLASLEQKLLKFLFSSSCGLVLRPEAIKLLQEGLLAGSDSWRRASLALR